MTGAGVEEQRNVLGELCVTQATPHTAMLAPVKTRSKVSDQEIALLLAELKERQLEIIERGRSENYLFVLYFTALGAIVAGIAVLQSPGLALVATGDLLPTIVLLGALAMLALPADLVHLAFGVEIRRVYIQKNIEPRLRDLRALIEPSQGEGFRFEQFDRLMHKGWANALIVARTAFIWLPSAILFGYYLWLVWPKPGAPISIAWWHLVIIVLGLATVVICNRAFFKMNRMIRDALADEP